MRPTSYRVRSHCLYRLLPGASPDTAPAHHWRHCCSPGRCGLYDGDAEFLFDGTAAPTPEEVLEAVT